MQQDYRPLRDALLVSIACLAPILVGAALAILPVDMAGRLAAIVFGALFVLVAVLWPDAPKTDFRWLISGACISFCLVFLWPKYAYIPLDALPTKSPQRMFYLAFLAYFVFALSTSRGLRQLFAARIRSAPALMALVLLFFVWRLGSSLMARDPLAASYAALVEAFEFLTPFLLVIAIFRHKRDLEYLIMALLGASALIGAIALAEGVVEKNLFEPLIAIDRSRLEFFQEVLAAQVRDGQYRVKATFHHPLLLAEFMVCMLPLLFCRFGRAKALERVLLLVLLATILWVIYKAQSRSAIVAGLLAAFMCAGVFFMRTLARQRLDVRTVLSVMAIPVFLLLAGLIYSSVVDLAVGRTPAEYASSLARVAMLDRGIPLLFERPLLGHGIGHGALTLGFVGETGRITLDNYYLLLALDSGLPALVFLLAIVGWAVGRGLRATLADDAEEAYLGAALSISLFAFALVKSILGTEHNFPLFFILLGALVVLRSPYAQPDGAVSAQAEPRAGRRS